MNTASGPRRSTVAAACRWTTWSALCEGLRTALPSVLAPGEVAPAGAALDEAIKVYRWHRRLAGDARKRNALLQLLYKGG